MKVLSDSSLNLADYGEDIQKVFVVFLAVPKEVEFHQEKINYTRSESHLEVISRLPYDEVLEADEEVSMQLMKKALFRGIESCQELQINKFDWEPFQRQVKQILT